MTFIADQIRLRHPEPMPDAVPESEVCATCEGGGWESYGLGRGDPHFRECQTCGNPEDVPCP